jgi:hypothetical protein
MRVVFLLPVLALSALAQPHADAPLEALAEALGGAGRIDALASARIDSQTRVVVGNDAFDLRSTLDLGFPAAARWTVRLPGQTRVTWIDGIVGATVEGDSTRALSEAALAQAEGALWLHPLVLAARRAEVTVEQLADDLLRVTVPGRPEALLVGLNGDGRPSRITTFRRRAGRRDYVEVVLRDYREVDGVWVPHRIRQAVRGVLTGEETVRSVAFDVALQGAPFGQADG